MGDWQEIAGRLTRTFEFLELFTHSAGGVTNKDHALAEKISELV